jgi:hypothetical protein
MKFLDGYEYKWGGGDIKIMLMCRGRLEDKIIPRVDGKIRWRVNISKCEGVIKRKNTLNFIFNLIFF